jgi:hypothetical protein
MPISSWAIKEICSNNLTNQLNDKIVEADGVEADGLEVECPVKVE